MVVPSTLGASSGLGNRAVAVVTSTHGNLLAAPLNLQLAVSVGGFSWVSGLMLLLVWEVGKPRRSQ